MTMRWVIDSMQVAHAAHCMMIVGKTTPYYPAAQDIDGLVENLARVDVSNNHEAPSPLAPCDQCLLGLPIEDS